MIRKIPLIERFNRICAMITTIEKVSNQPVNKKRRTTRTIDLKTLEA